MTAEIERDILTESARVIEGHLQNVYDISELQILGRRERSESDRRGVLNAIQNRIGVLMMESMPPEPSLDLPESSEVDGLALSDRTLEALNSTDRDVSIEDIMEMEGNSDLKDNTLVQQGRIEHTAPKKIRLYAASEHGWLPRIVPVTNVRMCLKNGMRTHCGDCGRINCMANGDINDCPGRAQRAFARCPVCAKKVFDPLPLNAAATSESEAEEGEVVIDRYASLPPKARIEAKLESHLQAWHPQEGRAYGVRPPADPQAQRLPATMAGIAPPVRNEDNG